MTRTLLDQMVRKLLNQLSCPILQQWDVLSKSDLVESIASLIGLLPGISTRLNVLTTKPT